MALWIDSNNQLHDDDNGAALSLPVWPQGMTQATAAQIAAINAPKPPSVADFESAVQLHLDQFANTWQYESILSAASYANSTNTQFKNEALALIAWRDAVWTSCYSTMAAVQGGTQAMPTIAGLLASLPSAPARP